MARLRLFANLREAAGTGDVRMPGSTVGEVLAHASERFGSAFSDGLAIARVWVNGDEADTTSPVGDDDEIALIPPVSGGATAVRSPIVIELGLVLAIGVALFIANSLDLEWMSVTVVLVGGVWALDMADAGGRRGLPVAAIPVLAGITGGVIATYRFGAPGTAAATVLAAIGVIVWAIVAPRFRPMDSIAASVMLAVMGTFGVSSLVLLRLRSKDEMTSFLIVIAVAVALSWVASRVEFGGLDPIVIGMGGAIIAGGLAAALFADEIAPTLAAAFAAAVALVAGRNFGTLVRAGGFFLVGPVPGSLAYLDGVLPAAGAFWIVLQILA